MSLITIRCIAWKEARLGAMLFLYGRPAQVLAAQRCGHRPATSAGKPRALNLLREKKAGRPKGGKPFNHTNGAPQGTKRKPIKSHLMAKRECRSESIYFHF